jgi:hypothetical protein
VLRFQGELSVLGTADGPCYRCLYPEPPPAGQIPSCADAGVLAFYESEPDSSRVRGIDLGTGSQVWEEPVDGVLTPSLPLRGGPGSDPVPTARFVVPVANDAGASSADGEFSLRSTESGEELGRFGGLPYPDGR